MHYLLYSRRELEPLLAHPAVRASGSVVCVDVWCWMVMALGDNQVNIRHSSFLSHQPTTHTSPAYTHSWLGAVPLVMAHFGRLFDETEETLSVEKAMELLERCVLVFMIDVGVGGWVGG